LAVSPSAKISVLNLVAFSSGFAFELDIEAEIEAEDYSLQGFEYIEGGPIDAVFRFGLEFADGRRATNLDHVEGRPPGKMGLTFYSTAARPKARTVSVWAWPLPPGRSLTMGLDWKRFGIDFTRVDIDAAAIRATGERSGRMALGSTRTGS